MMTKEGNLIHLLQLHSALRKENSCMTFFFPLVKIAKVL